MADRGKTLFIIELPIFEFNFSHKEREESCQADWAFVMDESSSMSREDFELQKEFLVRLVNELDPRLDGAHVAIFKFAAAPTPILFFNDPQDCSSIVDMINKTQANPIPSTNTDEALQFANDTIFTNETGMRPFPIPKNLVVITDGMIAMAMTLVCR